MNLDDQLRAALSQEADMQQATHPDVDRLISGGRVRRRRRNLVRGVGAALALVLVAGGAYTFLQIDRSDENSIVDTPKGPPQLPEDAGASALEPGPYRVPVGSGADGAAIVADLTFEGPGRKAGNFPTLNEGVNGGFGVYSPLALAAGSGCTGDDSMVEAATTPEALAQQLAALPGSTVIRPVSSTEMLGRDALHLRVRIPQECPINEGYRVAETPRGSRGISYAYASPQPGVVMDFWVMEEAGVAVVLDSWHEAGASRLLLDGLDQAIEATRFVTP
jgi:hypothetical protein